LVWVVASFADHLMLGVYGVELTGRFPAHGVVDVLIELLAVLCIPQE
jgi:hypothetical protein